MGHAPEVAKGSARSDAPAAMDYAQRKTTPSTILPLRLLACIWRQAARTPRCPDTPRLDGKLAMVTGGNAGIGREIARGLAKRGAEVIVAARNAETAKAACESIAAETGALVRHLPLDLARLGSVVEATERLRELSGARPVDVLVANAGIWPQERATSTEGHELAFAVNTLAHHVLVRRMLAQKQLRGRLVVLTGDIYIRASECTSDFSYEGPSGGALAYCRSKLGNLWFVRELGARHPELEVVAVHPGVVESGLGGGAGPPALIRGAIMIGCEAGAQAPLFCATQPNLERGGYYHNTMGLVRLPASDPAMDAAKAAALWARLEELARDFV